MKLGTFVYESVSEGLERNLVYAWHKKFKVRRSREKKNGVFDIDEFYILLVLKLSLCRNQCLCNSIICRF